jgi:hypothetical protein
MSFLFPAITVGASALPAPRWTLINPFLVVRVGGGVFE